VGVVLFVFLFVREVWCGMGWLVVGGERERGGAARALRDYIYVSLWKEIDSGVLSLCVL
jgi:hypothetical protein